MSHLGIIILDEAHHCDRDHPYALLLREFWARPDLNETLGGGIGVDVTSRPRLIGLTASPVQVRHVPGVFIREFGQGHVFDPLSKSGAWEGRQS